MKKIFLFIILFIATHKMALSQSIGIGTTSPNASAQLDITSTTKGTLLPRMTTAQRKAIANPEPGLMVFDTDKRTIMIYEGIRWGQLAYKDSDQMTETIMRKDSLGQVNDRLGASVAIDGEYAIAGSPFADNGATDDQGTAFIFHRINGTWIQEAKLLAADGAAYDLFGYSVSISGNYAVVGAYQKDGAGTDTSRGAAYVFFRTGNVWAQQAKLTAADGLANDHFGYSVGISYDNIIVGAPDDNVGAAADQGSVYFYSRNGTAWQQDIRLSSSGAGNHLGFSVSISSFYAIASAPGNSSASVYINGIPTWAGVSGFTRFGAFGSAVSINGETAAVGDYSNNQSQGIVYVFIKGAFGIWTEQTFLYGSSPQPEDAFGFSVSVKGDQLLVGSPATVYAANQPPGSAFLFTRTGTIWTYKRKIEDSSPQAVGQFGNSVAIDGFNMIIGAHFNSSRRGEVHFLNLE
jgi:FG-GAP repeat